VILSDRTIREQLAAGRIVIDPLEEANIQPSSVDLRLDRYFRVFLNHTMPVIDVKQNLEELTHLIEVNEDDAFILHPGEFVLGSTFESLTLPDDIVGRVEGKSSLGRLGLLIHSSLPASEPVLVNDADGVVLRSIGELVKEQRPCEIVGFHPETFEVGYHEVTGFYEGPADRIYEVRLASGRTVRVTAGHNLFTVGADGELRKVRTAELTAGVQVAVPGRIPEPSATTDEIDVLALVPEADRPGLVIEGPTVGAALIEHADELAVLLQDAGYAAVSYYRRRHRLPWVVAAQVPDLLARLGPEDRIGRRGQRQSMPARVVIDPELAWTLGMYVAEGHRRSEQVTISNTDQARLDRLERAFERLGIYLHRSDGAVTCCCSFVAEVFGWLGMGGKAPTKRVPPTAFGWSDENLRAFLDGLVDGDGSIAGGRTSVWTTSQGLVADLLVLFARLGRRAGSTCKQTARLPLWQVYTPDGEHKLLTSVPLPEELLCRARHEAGLSQVEAAGRAGYRNPTDLNNIERRYGRDAVRRSTLRRLRDAYANAGVPRSTMDRLDRLVDGDLLWDRVVEVVDTGEVEPIYDLEVKPGGRTIQNFLAGAGGVFVSNTAGFIDAGWDGHMTLELSNVANLPITLYPGMKIGQISFLQMTTPADQPYGTAKLGSKYRGQRGPTPSRYFENFEERDDRG
jgi:deoxycytidine triphosphate deaminase/intein/homing endonuclease